MGDRKSKNRNIRNLTKIAGKSFGITFPIDIIRSLGWRKHQKLIVKQKGHKIIVKDWK